MSGTQKCILCGNRLLQNGPFSLVCCNVNCELLGTVMRVSAILRLSSKIESQPSKEGVEVVRISVPVFQVHGTSDVYVGRTGDERSGPGESIIAWLTADIPLPTLPTVVAKVEGVKVR